MSRNALVRRSGWMIIYFERRFSENEEISFDLQLKESAFEILDKLKEFLHELPPDSPKEQSIFEVVVAHYYLQSYLLDQWTTLFCNQQLLIQYDC